MTNIKNKDNQRRTVKKSWIHCGFRNGSSVAIGSYLFEWVLNNN